MANDGTLVKNTAQIDYLRLASWREGEYTKTLAKIMKAWEGNWSQSKWLQYSGWRKEEFFIGQGEQAQKHHVVAGVSGNLANRLLKSLTGLTYWYATRLDIQVTIYCPDDMVLADVRNRCKTDNTTLIESKENATLYLGSRRSELFTRLYEKPIIDKYLRLEFELKGCRARTAWTAIAEGEPVERIFLYYLRRSKLPEDTKVLFEKYDIDATNQAMREIETHDNAKVWAWMESLDDTFTKHMNNHQIGERVKTLVRAWASHADYLDKNATKGVQ